MFYRARQKKTMRQKFESSGPKKNLGLGRIFRFARFFGFVKNDHVQKNRKKKTQDAKNAKKQQRNHRARQGEPKKTPQTTKIRI